MAKKAVATLRLSSSKNFAKVITMSRSKKTGSYTFQEDIIPAEHVNEFLKKGK